MAESHSKSKLKRKKFFAEDQQPQKCPRGPPSSGHKVTAVFCTDRTAETGRSVAPAAEWWNSEQLPAVERLWALTLRSALPDLENQHRHLVPDLPPPSTARPTALKLEDQRWCDLSEEVPPFPEPSPPSPRTSTSPDPLGLGSSQQDLSVRTKPARDPPEGQPSSHSSQGHNGKTTPFQDLNKRLQPPLHSWEGAMSSAGPSGVGRKKEKTGGKETGLLNRQLFTEQVRVSDRRASLQKDESQEEVVKSKEEKEVQRSGVGDGEAAGGGGGVLQSCPMCLLVFPPGFTQMDCDGHLAQCLSDVNVDVTW